MEKLSLGAEEGGVVFQTKILNFLIGIVQHRVKMAANVCQRMVNGGEFFLQRPAHLPGGVRGGIGGFRFDQVNDGLCLTELQPAVQKRPLGKLAPLCRTGARLVQSLQPGGQDGGGTMAMEFHGVLSGIGVGGGGTDRHALVDDAVLLVPQHAQRQLSRRDMGQGYTAFGLKDLLSDLDAVIAAEAQNTDGADLIAGGYGGDGMRHGRISL